MEELSSRYDASQVEQKWYARWEEAGLFAPDADPSKPSFTITIPPPNITGSLHMGHALCYSIHDLLGRYHRQKGYSVLILPGQDHAGIATQGVVEKQLRKEGLSGMQLGREKFVERVWQWRQESGDTILGQFRRLGCAFDWPKNRFTLDEGYIQAVLKVFIEWYERGLIYRGKRVVNWDPVLRTSVSDIETERQLTKGKLYYIRYPFADGSGDVVIATTRPETMLADVAVAVHPSDARYEGKVGKMLRLPLMDREIPLIADMYPDPEFGSGAVKITPAHDPNDYEVGARHGLEMPVVLDETAKINDFGGVYKGLDRYEARKRVVADLEEQGYLVKIEDHDIALIISERSGQAVEPLLSEQWFVSQTSLAGEAIKVVESGEVSFYPRRYDGIYLDWMRNIRDWCISRQLWWGHRIPVYYTEDGQPFAAMSWEEAESKAGKPIVRQDDDVLDTWFSSGLWPFATLGWPEPTEDLKRYYPTSILITARDIIYLWVARMIMMGIDFQKAIPFERVLIYATVLTEDGKRMSKSLGTGIDPMEIIESMGADALRFALLSQTSDNQEIRYGARKAEEARNFCNKIANATRFMLQHVREVPSEPTSLEVTDQWLLSRLARTEQIVRQGYESYNFQEAAQALYRFFWNDLCDWYIEVAKPRLESDQADTVRWVLVQALENFFVMMHPIMPHITEELYQHLPAEGKSAFLMLAPWPKLPASFVQEEAESKVERAFDITRALRALRAELGLAPNKWAPVAYVDGDLTGVHAIVASQAKIEDLRMGAPAHGKPALFQHVGGVDIFLPFGDLMTPEQRVAEVERLKKELEKIAADVAKLSTKLENPQFVERAKPEVVEKDRALLAELQEKVERTQSRLVLFQ